jgi:hypothetical protein
VCYNRDTCTFNFVTAFFTVTELWKHSRCPLTDEWMKKMWYILQQDEIVSFAEKWVELEIFMFSEISQTKKDNYYHMFSCTEYIPKRE